MCVVPDVAGELEGFTSHPPLCFFGVFDGHGGDQVFELPTSQLVKRPVGYSNALHNTAAL